MSRTTDIRRVVVVVLDGLRPDAIERFDLSNVRRLAHGGAATLRGSTVSPSLTWPALTSLLTGVSPDVHGILADSVHLPRPRAKLAPLAGMLRRAGYPTSAFLGEVPLIYRGVASRIAEGLGFSEARFVGSNAPEVLLAAQTTLRAQKRGLVFIHWSDADVAGHAHAWMSAEYGEAARGMDAALGMLESAIAIHDDPHTMLVALADHGGGGIVPTHHDGEHELNRTIPLIFAGASLYRCQLGDVRLLDVPPTIAYALGVAPPPAYAGRVVSEIFASDEADAA